MLTDLHTDNELLALLAQQNEQAFQMLYSRYWKRLYSAAFKRLPDPDIVQDILQDIFLQLWLRRADLNIANLEAYLLGAVRNRVLKYFEVEGRYTPLNALMAELGYSSSNADALVLRDELRQAYHGLLKTLTPSQQKILQLRYEQDLNTEEIAQILEITRKTVQNQLRTALVQIRTSLLALALAILSKHSF